MRCVRLCRAGVSNSIIFRYNVIIQLVFRDLPHLVRQKLVEFACGLPAATVHKMRAAADYADEWFNKGSLAFRVYCVCMAGPAWNPCCTLILSKQWNTLHDDHMASGQRWYCMCGARYRPKFGVVVEFVFGPNDVRYCRAEFPDYTLKEIKLMQIEKQFGQTDMSPQEFYDAIPEVQPMDRGAFLQEIPTNPGHYHFDQNMFEGLGAIMKWYNLLACIAG